MILKKEISILLIFVYLSSLMGFIIIEDYCCENEKSTFSFTSISSESCCSKVFDNCCKTNKIKILEIKEHSVPSKITNLTPLELSSFLLASTPNLNLFGMENSTINSNSKHHDPPTIPGSRTILFRSILI